MRSIFVTHFFIAVAQGALLVNTTFSVGGPVTLTTNFTVGGAVTLTRPATEAVAYTTSSTIASSTSTTSPAAEAVPYDDRYWHPKIGSKFQIILDRNATRRDVEVRLVPDDAEIFDLDLFDTPIELIQQIHDEGKRVICYFSAGGSESWREDYSLIKSKDKGERMKRWPNERWLNIRSPDVWEVMRRRIELAGNKGCDGIDADNTDVFNDDSGRGGGFNPPLSENDTIDFVKKLAAEAHRNGVALGIKNAEDIFPGVIGHIDFAVNEECATYGCSPYEILIGAGKPVFHIEYANYVVRRNTIELKSWYPKWRTVSSAQLPSLLCLEANFTNTDGDYDNIKPEAARKVSTVIKTLDLTQFVMYCDGSWVADK